MCAGASDPWPASITDMHKDSKKLCIGRVHRGQDIVPRLKACAQWRWSDGHVAVTSAARRIKWQSASVARRARTARELLRSLCCGVLELREQLIFASAQPSSPWE